MTFGQTNETATFGENRFYSFNTFVNLLGGGPDGNGDAVKIKSAKAVNNLEYKKSDGSVIAKTGVWIETESGLKFGLFKWDLNILSYLDYSDDVNNPKVKATTGILTDIIHKHYLEGEEKFFTAVAKAIVGKTVAPIIYTKKSTKGNIYPSAIFAVK